MSARVPSIALLIYRINVCNTGLIQNFNARINRELCTWIAEELMRENIQWILRREVVGTGSGSCRVGGSGIRGAFSATLFLEPVYGGSIFLRNCGQVLATGTVLHLEKTAKF